MSSALGRNDVPPTGHHARISFGRKSSLWFPSCECGWLPIDVSAPSWSNAMGSVMLHHLQMRIAEDAGFTPREWMARKEGRWAGAPRP